MHHVVATCINRFPIVGTVTGPCWKFIDNAVAITIIDNIKYPTSPRCNTLLTEEIIAPNLGLCYRADNSGGLLNPIKAFLCCWSHWTFPIPISFSKAYMWNLNPSRLKLFHWAKRSFYITHLPLFSSSILKFHFKTGYRKHFDPSN